MKKKILMPFAAILTLASCSSDEMVEQSVNPSGEPIIRFGAIVDNNTRAGQEADINVLKGTAENPGTFMVKAKLDGATDNFFNAQKAKCDLSSDHSDGHFYLTTPYYWPESGKLNFTAWWPNPIETEGATDSRDFGDENYVYEINDDRGKTVTLLKTDGNEETSNTEYTEADVLVAFKQVEIGTDKQPVVNTNGCVDLQFQHALSQIVIKAKVEEADNISVEISSLTLKNVPNKGKLVLPNATQTKPSWTMFTGAKADYVSNFNGKTVTLISGEIDTSKDGKPLKVYKLTPETGSFLVMPQTFNHADWTNDPYLVMDIIVRDRAGKNIIKNKVASAVDLFKYFDGITMEGGKRYVFTLKFSAESLGNEGNPNGPVIGLKPITFDVSVDPWSNHKWSTNPDVTEKDVPMENKKTEETPKN